MSAGAGPADEPRAAPRSGVDPATMLRARLAVLSPRRLDIRDDSHLHAGHAGASSGAGHFSLLIVSDCFAGLTRLQRHQRVLREVGDLVPHPVHALSIRALAPDESPT